MGEGKGMLAVGLSGKSGRWSEGEPVVKKGKWIGQGVVVVGEEGGRREGIGEVGEEGGERLRILRRALGGTEKEGGGSGMGERKEGEKGGLRIIRRAVGKGGKGNGKAEPAVKETEKQEAAMERPKAAGPWEKRPEGGKMGQGARRRAKVAVMAEKTEMEKMEVDKTKAEKPAVEEEEKEEKKTEKKKEWEKKRQVNEDRGFKITKMRVDGPVVEKGEDGRVLVKPKEGGRLVRKQAVRDKGVRREDMEDLGADEWGMYVDMTRGGRDRW